MNKLYATALRWFGVTDHTLSSEVRDASHQLANESFGLSIQIDKMVKKSDNPLGDLVSAMQRSKGRPEN